MLYFASPEYLWLLFLVPLIPVVYGILRALRRRRIRKFGDEALVRELMPSWSGAKGWVRIILFSLAFLAFTIGIARPQMGAKLKEHEAKGAEIMICLDVSNSMLAETTPLRVWTGPNWPSREWWTSLRATASVLSSLPERPSCSCR